jgi:hypothetical protein
MFTSITNRKLPAGTVLDEYWRHPQNTTARQTEGKRRDIFIVESLLQSYGIELKFLGVFAETSLDVQAQRLKIGERSKRDRLHDVRAPRIANRRLAKVQKTLKCLAAKTLLVGSASDSKKFAAG